MSTDLDRIRDRVRQNRAARRQTFADTHAPASCAEGRLGCAFVAGDRVVDLVTGEEGVVIAGTRETVVVPTTQR
jgi:hypothetical protein